MPRIRPSHPHAQPLVILALLLVWSYVVPTFAAGCATVQLGSNAKSFDVGIAPRSMVTADLNHDGKNDLAIANYGSGQGEADGSVSILLNDGLGGFSNATNIPVGLNPRSIVSADFNKDGNPDLAVVHYISGMCCISSFVTILLGNGAGGFVVSGSPFAVGADASSLVAGDFNKDGTIDLAATVAGSVRGVAVLLGNGSGGFGSATTFATDGNADSIATGDFNADSKPDLVTSGSNNSNISVLLGNGSGGFGSAVKYSIGANPQFIAVGDINEDNKLDVVLAAGNSVSILPGNGDGSFGVANLITLPSTPRSVLVQDVSGDGKLDLITANSPSSTVSVLVGDGHGSFSPQASYASGFGSFFVLSSDFNEDGKSDLAVANLASNSVTVLAGLGSAVFAGARTFNTGVTPLSVAAGDLNGDGKIDLVLPNGNQNSISVLLGEGNGLFGPDVKFPTVFSPRDVVLEDFNGDGKLDAAVAEGVCCNIKQSVAVLLGNGNGGFGAATSFDAGTNALAIVSADFNKDGKADLAVVNNADSNFSILIGDGNGAFAAPANIALNQIPSDIATGDLNGDGNVDLIVGTSPISVFLGNGAGGFSLGTTLPLSLTYPVSLAIGDINGDGLADLATANNDDSISVFRGDGSGGFAAAVSYFVPSPKSIAVADINGDGNADLTASSGSGNVVVLPGDGAGAFGSPSFFIAGSGPTGILPIDLNADGRLDLAIANGANYLSVLLNTCSAAPAVTPRLSVGDVAVAEGNKGQVSASLAVSLSAASSQTVTVSYFSSNKTATAGVDYQSVSGHLTFPPGVTTQTINVPINGDETVEPDEDFNVFLANPLNAAIEKGKGTGRILNDDNPTTLAFSASSYTVSEGGVGIDVTLLRSGDLAGTSTVDYSTSDTSGSNNCSAIHGIASSRCDYETTIGTLHFAANETSKTIRIPIVDDTYAEGNENFTINLSNPTGATLDIPSTATITINDNETVNGTNPIDQASFLVHQHYTDFLNREPDASGLAFWSNQITECQQPGATCSAAVRRINVSAAFFLSIEFQETGYLVERIYKTAFGDATGTSNFGPTHQLAVPIVRLHEFLPDSQQIGKGLVVGQAGWEQVLENNKVAFILQFVQRSRFSTSYSALLTPAQFVDQLFAHAGVTPTTAERTAAINEFGGAATSNDNLARARALRRVAENSTLNGNEKNSAFVLMQYFGYLRRNPNDPQDTDYSGYDFWLTKLNQFNGNFVNADMVQAFIDSGEYRGRFGP